MTLKTLAARYSKSYETYSKRDTRSTPKTLSPPGVALGVWDEIPISSDERLRRKERINVAALPQGAYKCSGFAARRFYNGFGFCELSER